MTNQTPAGLPGRVRPRHTSSRPTNTSAPPRIPQHGNARALSSSAVLNESTSMSFLGRSEGAASPSKWRYVREDAFQKMTGLKTGHHVVSRALQAWSAHVRSCARNLGAPSRTIPWPMRKYIRFLFVLFEPSLRISICVLACVL